MYMTAKQMFQKLKQNTAAIDGLMVQIEAEVWPPKRIELAKRAAQLQVSNSDLVERLDKYGVFNK